MEPPIELSALQKTDEAGHIPPLDPADLPGFRAEVKAFADRLAEAGVAFSAVPFQLPDGLDPAQLADDITAFFYRIRDSEGPILSLLWQQTTAFASGHPELAELLAAGERIAADFDRGIGAGQRNAYHNRQHTVEVLTCAHVLAMIDARSDHALPAGDRVLLLLAALIHDWHHDGGINGDEPFRLEKIAFRAARPYLAKLTSIQQQQLDLALRTTDTGGAHQFARAALAYQRLCSRMENKDKRPPPPPAPEGLEYLGTLMEDGHDVTVEIAAMLRDADVLGSAGLTADFAALNSSRLRDERAAPYAQGEYAAFLQRVLARPRTSYDDRPALEEEKPGTFFAFSSRPAQIFNANIPEVVRGHARLMKEMGEEPEAPKKQEPEKNGIDLSVFEQVRDNASQLGQGNGVALEAIVKLRSLLKSAGFFELPPFTLPIGRAGGHPSAPGTPAHLSAAEQTADSLQRLHGVSGPVFSAIVMQLFETAGLSGDDPLARAAAGVARDLDEGKGTGTLDDEPGGARNPYHNSHHILDLLLLCDMLGQRAAQRAAPASSPLARGLLLLAALVCHWHHNGRGNRVNGQYLPFHLQDRALSFAVPHLEGVAKELQQSLEILVRSTDPRDAYAFSRSAYSFHVGLGPRPAVPPGCESLARLLTDPALCTLCARLNDAIFVPFVGLGASCSARSIVHLGREIGQPIDFTFVRRSLIMPLLSRPPYPGEKVSNALLIAPGKVASFTSAEAQALFNPAMHILLLHSARLSEGGTLPRPAAPAASTAPASAAAPPDPEPGPEPAPSPQAETPTDMPEDKAETPFVPAADSPLAVPASPPDETPEPVPEPETVADELPDMPAVPPIEEPEAAPGGEPPLSHPSSVPAVVPAPAPVAPALVVDVPMKEGSEAFTPPASASRARVTSGSFPYFRYHPDPIASGVIKPGPHPCVCCGQVRGFGYYGPVHEATLGERRLCPWCIADGSAHAKFGLLFADPQPLLQAGLNPEIIKEVTRQTPGYQSWQRDRWLSHCRDACAFSGDASSEEARQAPSQLRRAMLEYYDMSEKSWPTLVSRYAPGGDPGIYKFTCRHCGLVQYAWDCT